MWAEEEDHTWGTAVAVALATDPPIKQSPSRGIEGDTAAATATPGDQSLREEISPNDQQVDSGWLGAPG